MSVDIDSCDLWVFLAMVQESTYRPFVVSVEYNINYAYDESKTNRCRSDDGSSYTWEGDNTYGASFQAINQAAQNNGYCVVWVVETLDVFLVRSDLICKDQCPDPKVFKYATGKPFHRESTPEQKEKWVMEYCYPQLQNDIFDCPGNQ